MQMNQNLLAAAAAGGLLALTGTDPALAHKQGGILQMPDFASPASMSMHEESTITAEIPLMGVFNNLVVFDQHVAQNSCPEYREMKAATLRAPFHHGRHSELQGLK
jgi:hypothetical protein